MEKKQKNKQEDDIIITKREDTPTNSLKIGEVVLQSDDVGMEQLANLSIAIIEHPSIKEYLKTIDSKKLSGMYS